MHVPDLEAYLQALHATHELVADEHVTYDSCEKDNTWTSLHVNNIEFIYSGEKMAHLRHYTRLTTLFTRKTLSTVVGKYGTLVSLQY